MGLVINLLIACFGTIALLYWAKDMVNIFLIKGETDITKLATTIIRIIWPMLIFAAANITLTAYLTGMQCAKQSALIALTRSLVLPVLLVIIFWKFFGFMYVFYALPMSEICVFILALFLLQGRLPRKLVNN